YIGAECLLCFSVTRICLMANPLGYSGGSRLLCCVGHTPGRRVFSSRVLQIARISSASESRRPSFMLVRIQLMYIGSAVQQHTSSGKRHAGDLNSESLPNKKYCFLQENSNRKSVRQS